MYVDDFLVLAPTREECEQAKCTLVQLLLDLGFTLSAQKIVGPERTMVFLGLELSTRHPTTGKMQVHVPKDKMEKAQAKANKLLTTKTVTRHQLESAVGYFRHIAAAILPVKAFLRRMRDALAQAAAHRHATIPMTRDLELDLRFWAANAHEFNGTAVILEEPTLHPGYLATDASGEIGMGGFFDERTFSVRWTDLRHHHQRLPAHVRKWNIRKLWPDPRCPNRSHINYKELYAIFWALLLWGDEFEGKFVTLLCDNITALTTANCYWTRANGDMMRLARHLAMLLARRNIRLEVVYIESAANALADALSRDQKDRYAEALQSWRQQPPRQAPKWTPRVPKAYSLLLQTALAHRATHGVYDTPHDTE